LIYKGRRIGFDPKTGPGSVTIRIARISGSGVGQGIPATPCGIDCDPTRVAKSADCDA